MSHKSVECRTCNVRPKTDCPGHFGFIELEVPIYHLGFFKHIIMSLNCLCRVLILNISRIVVRSSYNREKKIIIERG